MPTGRQRSRSWLPYLYLGLVPLSLVGLDSYGWLFTRERAATQPTGLWPRHLSASQPHRLGLLLPEPEQAPDSLLLQRGGAAPQILKAQAQGPLWQVDLPPLPAGDYQLQPLRKGSPVGAPASISLRQRPDWELRSDRQAYLPGDWMQVTTRLLAPRRGLELEVLGPDGRSLHRAPLSGNLSSERVRLPEDLPPGRGQILLHGPVQGQLRPLARRSFELLSQQPAGRGLRLIAARTQRLSGLDQPLGLMLCDSDGSPVGEGWIRMLGQTLAVREGLASFALSAQAPDRISYTAGDNRGNLLQGELRLEPIAGDWLAFAERAGLQVLARKPLSLSWVIGQGQTSLSQGQLSLKAGLQRLDLPSQLGEGPHWIALCDEAGDCQQLRWLPAPAAADWRLDPAEPHALQPLRVSPPQLPAGQLETWRSQQLGYEVLRFEHERADGLFQQIGAPAPAREQPLALSLWALAGLALAAAPLRWLQRSLHSKPFPDAARRLRASRGQQSVLIGGGLALGALILSWAMPTLAAGLASLAGLGVAVASGLLMRPLLRREHPLMPWVPGLQVLLLIVLGWFCLIYQPGMIGAVILSWGLLCLRWSELWQALIPVSQLQPQRRLLLAALVVGVAAHSLLQLAPGHRQPEPAISPRARWQQIATHSLVARGRLLQHQLLPDSGAQILPASRRSGPQSLNWRLWANDGSVSSWAMPLKVQPAVLAEALLPAYALVGDSLELPIRLLNETGKPQASAWRLGTAGESLNLAPRSSQTRYHAISLDRPGWLQLSLEHRFSGSWFAQPQSLYVQAKPATQTDPRLLLKVELPEHQNLVPGQEIPVLVHLRQSSGRSLALGIQIGLPAGFSALTDTLDDSAHRDWLRDWRPAPGSLQLRTRPLASGQDVSFHFRLRAELPGSFQMPPPRLFQLDTPKIATVLPVPAVLEVKKPE